MIDLHLKGTGYASYSTLLFIFLLFISLFLLYIIFYYFYSLLFFIILLGMDPKCMLTSTDLQTRRARCQHQLSFLLWSRGDHCNTVQIACGCVTYGSPDHARPRCVMIKDLTLSTLPGKDGSRSQQ